MVNDFGAATSDNPLPKDSEPGCAPSSGVPSAQSQLPPQHTAFPRPLLIALILLSIGFSICLVHCLTLKSSLSTWNDGVYWSAVILLTCGSGIAFVNRSHPLAPASTAFGLLLLVICFRLRIVETTHATPGLTLNMTSKVPAAPAEALTVSLPDAKVELHGLSSDWNGTLTSDWWRANGAMVRRRTWSMDVAYQPQFEEGYARRLVVCIRGTQTPPHLLAFDFDGKSGACSEQAVITADPDAGEWLVLSKIFGGNQTMTNLRMLIGSGSFQEAGTTSLALETALKTPAETEGDFGDVRFSTRPVEHQGKEAIQLNWHSTSPEQTYEFRVRLVDHEERSQIAPRLQRREFKMDCELAIDRTVLFSIPTGIQIAKVIVERRRAYWVEFREVSLLAGHYTSAQGVLGRGDSD